eukprot:TRINITY_DN5670_c0_g1_i1.p1 TRINITY_DN5670_c0_g1~~TRINITY_DN5670_c0_g1_i1.p1  ORF type:complete len:393 (-),score=59.42 TRINITY_DN5670_c0_g1_i1:92-1270(-)
MSGEAPYLQHIKGKKHLARLRGDNLAMPVSKKRKLDSDGPTKDLFCDTCDVFCTSKETMGMHLRGKKHTKNTHGGVGSERGELFLKALWQNSNESAYRTITDESNIVDNLLQRLVEEISLPQQDSFQLSSLIQMIRVNIKYIAINHPIEEVVVVGPFCRTTTIRGNSHANLSIIFGIPPSKRLITQFYYDLKDTINSKYNLSFKLFESGYDIVVYSGNNKVYLDFSWSNDNESNINSNDRESDSFVDIENCQKASERVQRVLWFNNFIKIESMENIVSVIKLFKYYALANEMWKEIDEWKIELIVCRGLTKMKGNRAGLSNSIRTIFEFVSSGCLYPGSDTLRDPCDDEENHIMKSWSKSSLLKITRESQSILNSLAFSYQAFESIFPELRK